MDSRATTEKVCNWIQQASRAGAELVAFGESFLPGYPFWVDHGGASRFVDEDQRAAYARYLEAGIESGGPELTCIASAARECGIHVYVGIAERGVGNASGTLFCTLVAIDPEHGVVNMHRKLSPTFGERLVWGRGDGHGLRVQALGNGWSVGGLNCWENWMPQARHAIYAGGANLHIALWPGSVRNTCDITRFIALEGRCYVISASTLLGPADIPESFPLHGECAPEFDGGSAIAGPDGAWVIEPVAGTEGLIVAELDLERVRRARQQMDATGHYSRPDVFEVHVHRRRLDAVVFDDD
ncbi:MAG: nitrilase [Chlamydiales bacterium]|jgi:nitrilase